MAGEAEVGFGLFDEALGLEVGEVDLGEEELVGEAFGGAELEGDSF